MRLSNVVIGFLLAVVLAYIHDASVPTLSATGQPQNIVNWEVFGHSVAEAGAWLRHQVDLLVDQIHWRQ